MQIVKKACKYISESMIALMIAILIIGFVSPAEYLPVMQMIYIIIYTIASGIYLAIPEKKG